MGNKTILAKKQEVIDEISDNLKKSASVIFFDYRGLTDGDLMILRRQLREEGSSFKIFKNTLTIRALNEINIDMSEVLKGPSAMAISADEIAPIKVLSNFTKLHSQLKIKGGIINGKQSNLEELSQLATVPSREGLLTMLAGGLIGVVKDLSICLNMYADEKSE